MKNPCFSTKKLLLDTSSIVFFTIAAFLFLHSLFFTPFHDWDIDSFLYLGSRLSSGDLLFQNEFETKLPIIQYLFWLPSKLGGIGTWRIINFSAILVILMVSAKNLKKIYSINPWLIVSVFLAQTYALPGGSSSHISVIAGSLMILSLSYLLQPCTKTIRIFVSGFILSLAISIRLNYAFVLPAIFLVGFIYPRGNYTYTETIAKTFTLAAGFFLGLTLEFFPYLINGDLDSLNDGIKAIIIYSQGISFWEIIKIQLGIDQGFRGFIGNAPYFLSIYFAMPVILLGYIKSLPRYRLMQSSFWKISLLSIIAIILLQISFSRSHYHQHYSLLLLPFSSLIFLSMVEISFSTYFKQKTHITPFLSAIALVFFTTGLLVATADSFSYSLHTRFFNSKINVRNFNMDALERLSDLKNQGYSFYVYDNTNYHRLLNEPRIGDGHPAMIEAIFHGKKIGPIGTINMFSKRSWDDPCISLTKSSKNYIFIQKNISQSTNSMLYKCMESAAEYQQICNDANESSLCKSFVDHLVYEKLIKQH